MCLEDSVTELDAGSATDLFMGRMVENTRYGTVPSDSAIDDCASICAASKGTGAPVSQPDCVAFALLWTDGEQDSCIILHDEGPSMLSLEAFANTNSMTLDEDLILFSIQDCIDEIEMATGPAGAPLPAGWPMVAPAPAPGAEWPMMAPAPA